ncbi:MarR family winged helix-turn-helix transcriptional regulator [Nocardia cyriacigeorgica]|uniref:Putative transcriptional regulator, MarR-family n=1 Tax=Nocardia cyriacigeorgica (strain GUH-2) TaxID=1127134 RepID=H6RBF9_NOCCG|nr:MarR family transcriptional regulator [Nocardia cyriacigeorgica]BDT87451.1 MarR family transcriptional regulator [Nocardia cyriacigeorgica]CCF63798.1 putative transcriptional regulator, MarR-family [Nocardia cyriacigeorgica GUH-2]
MTEALRVDTAQLMELLAVSLGAYYGDFTLAAASENLTASQAKTLTALRRGPVAMRALADALSCDASNVTGIINRLEKRGLVRREPSAVDRRVTNLVITPDGEQITDAIRAKMHRTRDGLDRLSDAERTQLRDLLERVFTKRQE